MNTKIGFKLWIYWVILPLQFNANAYLTESSHSLTLGDDYLRKMEIGTEYIVYPQIHTLSRRKRRNSEDDTAAMLVLRTPNVTYYVELELNEQLMEIPVTVNGITFEYHQNRCHFHGKIINKPNGQAAISACSEDGSLTGVLMTGEKTFYLSPVTFKDNLRQEQKSNSSSHFLIDVSDENVKFCGTNNAKRVVSRLDENLYEDPESDSKQDRIKRAPSSSSTTKRKVIELAVFVDNELYKRIEATAAIDARTAAIRRVLGILNQVQLIYNYPSLETKFKFVVVKLEILKSSQDSPNAENGDIDKYLDNFCVWQSRLNVREGSIGHWDHAIMLTGKDLFKQTRGKRNPKVLGLAWVNGMCRTNYSCTLNEGTSFEAAFVIAHEIAHNLGVMHDGSGNNCDRNKFIMSDKTGPGKVHWSLCSNAYIKNFFRNGYGWCLEDDASPPNRSFDLQSQSLPGSRYSLSDQCILALGSGYSPHSNNKEPFNNVCRELWCASGTWAKPAHPALEGSPCGNGKICLQGLCRTSALLSHENSTNFINISTSTTSQESARHHSSLEPNGILRKIQETAVKIIRSLG